MPRLICRKSPTQPDRCADALAPDSTGSNNAARMAMMAMTTLFRSRVNPLPGFMDLLCGFGNPLSRDFCKRVPALRRAGGNHFWRCTFLPPFTVRKGFLGELQKGKCGSKKLRRAKSRLGRFRFAMVFSGGGVIFFAVAAPKISIALAPLYFHLPGGWGMVLRSPERSGRAGGLSRGRLGHGTQPAEQHRHLHRADARWLSLGRHLQRPGAVRWRAVCHVRSGQHAGAGAGARAGTFSDGKTVGEG